MFRKVKWFFPDLGMFFFSLLLLLVKGFWEGKNPEVSREFFPQDILKLCKKSLFFFSLQNLVFKMKILAFHFFTLLKLWHHSCSCYFLVDTWEKSQAWYFCILTMCSAPDLCGYLICVAIAVKSYIKLFFPSSIWNTFFTTFFFFYPIANSTSRPPLIFIYFIFHSIYIHACIHSQKLYPSLSVSFSVWANFLRKIFYRILHAYPLNNCYSV